MDDGLCRRLSIDTEGMREVVPGQVFMKHVHAEGLTVALYRVITGPDLPALPVRPHRHGEEVIIVLRGSAWVDIGGVDYEAGENEVLIVPADTDHTVGRPVQGDHFFLAITTPRRTDLGDADSDAPMSVPTYLDVRQ